MSKIRNDFLWGASTSAYQVEGSISEDGKVSSIMDDVANRDNYSKDITDFRDASGHYKNWKEDVKLFAEMGMKSYRFSISWPRIMKNLKGDVNEQGIKFYSDLIDELIKYKIEPVVTIYHFDAPNFIFEDGKFTDKRFIQLFENYCKVLFEAYGSKVKYWLTINELNMFAMASSAIGILKSNQIINRWQIVHALNVAQARAINLCHEMLPNAKIGPAPNLGCIYTNSSKPIDYTAKLNMDLVRNWVYLDIACKGHYSKTFLEFVKKNNEVFLIDPKDMEDIKRAKPDFIAFNYYSSMTVEMTNEETNIKLAQDQQSGHTIPNFAAAVKNTNLEKTQFGWEIDPQGFKNTLREVYERYNLPIMITENGIGARDVLTKDGKIHDTYRIEYYQKHISKMLEAINEGVDIIGYMPWSAIDLVSTHEGISKRYGFIYVNRNEFDLKDMKRYKKDSFYWYKDLIATNGEKI
ncbi:6-phospho-beta-glucosidase [Spiroplasma cantharicola]|uniref:6-phospho-beta-glucosidase n=2 Tax=Spiroplasma cantharicola TaxID=362837 RepID=A0A0M5KLN7_9MOLU|nr:glycoside hydrolase family 1 protein [Spiroplasma cantharicola]ALD66713.1 6-phospho-beta-glucosidase [Spiroplasma cantharicola]